MTEARDGKMIGQETKSYTGEYTVDEKSKSAALT